MHEGQEAGASHPHTVDSAASVIEGLLSDDSEDTQDRETPTEQPEVEQEATEEQPEAEESGEDEQPESEAESDEPAEEPDAPPQPRKLKVKNGDQEEEVTEDELVKGYLRQQDYTRKTQSLAEDRKKHSSEFDSVTRERAEIANRLTEVVKLIESATPKEPNWDKLREEAPDEFAATWALWQQHNKRIDALKAQEREAQEKVLRDQMTQRDAQLATEREKLLDAIPDWKKADVAKKERQELVEYATGLGFTEDQLREVNDHRVLVLLRNSMLYTKAQKAKPDVQKRIDKVKVATPGTTKAQETRPVAEITRRRQRLAKTGRVADAASVIEQMLDDN